MNDYIELGPDDVILDGDECYYTPYRNTTWELQRGLTGTIVSDHPVFKFRRSKNTTLIRDAAIELLKVLRDPSRSNYGREAVNLERAIGVSFEELREEK